MYHRAVASSEKVRGGRITFYTNAKINPSYISIGKNTGWGTELPSSPISLYNTIQYQIYTAFRTSVNQMSAESLRSR